MINATKSFKIEYSSTVVILKDYMFKKNINASVI